MKSDSSQLTETKKIMRIVEQLKVGDVVMKGDLDAEQITTIKAGGECKAAPGKFVAQSPRTRNSVLSESPLSLISFTLCCRSRSQRVDRVGFQGAAVAIGAAMVWCLQPDQAPSFGVSYTTILPGEVVGVHLQEAGTVVVLDLRRWLVSVHTKANRSMLVRGAENVERCFPGSTLPAAFLSGPADCRITRGSWEVSICKQRVSVWLAGGQKRSGWRSVWRYKGILEMPAKKAVELFFILNGLVAQALPETGSEKVQDE